VTEIEDQISLTIDTAVPLALILNELMTNSIRHAFTGYESGQVRIKFHETDGQEYRLIVEDNGTGFSPLSSKDSSKTLGMQLINILIEQLNGKYEISSDNGTRAAISFPAPNPARNKV
jgi:two-component sensor histidine kinase